MAMGNGAWTLSATAFAAVAQSSQVALSPGIWTPACSNRVLFTKGPVTVSCVIRPGMAVVLPVSRIQMRNGPKFFSQ